MSATSIRRLTSSGIGNNFLKTTGTKTQVITALRIKIPDVSDDIVFSCSAIFAAAITNDNVEVSKNADAMVVFVSNHRRINNTGKSFDIKNAPINTGIIINKAGSLISDGMSKSTPTIIKNIGIKKP